MSKRKGQAKLTSAIVEAIRNANERRGIVTALATQYGVSHSMISMIRAGKRWTQDQMTGERFKPDRLYAMHGSVLNAAPAAHEGSALDPISEKPRRKVRSRWR
jgi:hypothetical protein